MKIWKYKSYEEYVKAQTEANVRKLKKVWVRESTIDLIHSIVPVANNILCHGTRNAAEQRYFTKKYSNAYVIGTEISHTASQFPMTVQHDFHEENESWINHFDIVYSNSFDHSYDPVKCMKTWSEQLTHIGTLFIELPMGDNNRSKYTDPLELTYDDLLNLAEGCGLRSIDKIVLENFDSLCVFRK